MSTQHTPGPWQYGFEGGTVAFILEADGTTVAKLSTTENSTAHRSLPANARLIAAAPDLLNLVKGSRQLVQDKLDSGYDIEYWQQILSEIDAAIAKATGAA